MPIDHSYEAGIIDGEGSIGFGVRLKSSGKLYLTPIVQVSNTFEPLCRHFQETYGGRIWVNKDKRINRKTLYLWSVAGQKAVKILENVFPYLWIKRRQAELVFEFYKDKPANLKVTSEEIIRRTALYGEMKRLNVRGVVQ